MLVYYQDFGSTSSYRIQNYSTALNVLRARLHSGPFPVLRAGRASATAATPRWGWSAVMLEYPVR